MDNDILIYLSDIHYPNSRLIKIKCKIINIMFNSLTFVYSTQNIL